MTQKQIFRWMLMAAMVCGFGMSITSCKDDTISEEQRKAEEEAAQEEKASKFWDVVGQLVSMNDYTPYFEGKTFEPIIGNEDENDPQTRIIGTNTMEAAASSFAGLIGAHDIDERTVSREWSDPDVGSLSYRKVTNGSAWAEVTVNIPAVPHLTKIIYRSAEQGNTNGGVKGDGRAYYRFGDVIRRTNEDGYVEYWVCIRPAFDPEAKGDSHWATVSPLPKKNLWPDNNDGTGFIASNGREYFLPTGLSYKMEHLQNLAELLFAICYPRQWYENTHDYKPTIFHDFGESRVLYHNTYFWENVQRAWEKKQIAKTVFGKDLSWFAGNLQDEGLYFLYKGYSWWTWSENGPTLYQAHYVNTPRTKYCNMQTKNPDSKVQHDVVDKKNHTADMDFNVKEECTLAKPYIEKPGFFGDSNPRWIVRIAEGKELATNGKYSNNQMPIEGVEEIYRYYRDVMYSPNLDQEPEITSSTAIVNNDPAKQDISTFIGEPFYKPFAVYKDQNGHRWFVAYPAGISNKDHSNVETLTGSPYSYLVSLEGINYTADKQRATNLPNRDMAIKMTISLIALATNIARAPTEAELRQEAETQAPYMMQGLNVLDHADIHLSSLFLQTLPKSGVKDNAAWQVSVAYNDETAGQQKLLRLINHPDNAERQPEYYVWEHYPSVASDSIYVQREFSNDFIFLQDLANPDMVGYYGADAFACRPIVSTSLGDDVTKRKSRKVSDTDSRANDVTNYFYQRAPWLARTYPTDMWREPVLFMRVTRVYDRGYEYSNTTVNGLKLQQVSENPYMELESWDWLQLSTTFIHLVGEGFKDITIDGRRWTPSTWQQDVIR